ncbi:lymphocyte-specific protein 1 [Aulostomus maculatus]
MSNALLRRNSSKQGLQNLMRLTAQRSIEDAEEVERERRRRARKELCRRNSSSPSGESPLENEPLTVESKCDGSLKPSSSPSLEEDEGFSDWTQRRERRRQQRLQELSQGGCDEDEDDGGADGAAAKENVQASITSSSRLQRAEELDGARMEMERSKERREEEEEAMTSGRRAETQRRNIEEEKHRMREDIERRRMKSLTTPSVEGDEVFSPFGPKSPTHKITERTESLNRSLKKSNSFKKTQPLVLLAKIDDKKEQYAHAVENSQEARGVKVSLNDLPSSLELVSSKKNLFEAGDTWASSPSKGACSRDTEGLKVGVAGRITQWVKGPADSSRQSLSRTADVKSGDVMQKKNMWEIIGDSPGRPGQSQQKSSSAGKKYKFVVTGHGKYEKIPVDEEFSNGNSGFCHGDY